MSKRLSIIVSTSPMVPQKRLCPTVSSSLEPSTPTKRKLSRVTPFLLIGDDRVSCKDLLEHNVTAVLDCRSKIEQDLRGQVGGFDSLNRLSMPMRDSNSEDVSRYLYSAVEFIENERRKGGSVLVHCTRGISRSAAVVCAYLMWERQCDFRTALVQLREKHACADPNPSFAMQLVAFSQTRAMDTFAFEVTKDEIEMLGPLTKDGVDSLLEKRQGALILVSRLLKKQYIWCGEEEEASRRVAERFAHLLTLLENAPKQITNISCNEVSEKPREYEAEFQKAIALL